MNRIEIYQTSPDQHGNGMFFFTECGNLMYSVSNDPMTYHGKLCPKCAAEGEQVTLYIAGSEEHLKYAPDAFIRFIRPKI